MNVDRLLYVFLLFLMYAFIGWVAEVILAYFTHKKFINRGFLIGPYCPIYGVGVLLIVWLLKRYMDSALALFVLAMVICMALEYMTSFIMEKLFNTRWWDYSDKRFNINGRICLETAIPFGVGGLIIMYLVNPFFEGLLNQLSDKVILVLGLSLLGIFLVDLIISLRVILRVNSVDVSKYKDNTEVINKKVREYLMKHSVLTRRLMQSFPNAKLEIRNIKDKIIKKIEKVNVKKH